MHVSTASVVQTAGHVPGLRLMLAVAYPCVGPLVLLVLLAPVLFGKTYAARRFLLGAVLCALITAACFARWPAIGPWTTEHFAPSQRQEQITEYLQRLKSPGPVNVDVNATAIVSFPSFHVALMLVLAAGLASLRPLRIPIWILAGLVCVSTLTTGWHYFIDVLGGVAVALVSMCAAVWLDRRLVPG